MVYQYATVINVACAGSGRGSRRNYMYITAYIHNEFKSSHDVSNVSCLSFSNSFLTVSSHPSTQLRTATAVATAVDKYQ